MRDKNLLAVVFAPLLVCNIAFAQPRYTLTPVRPFFAPAGMNDLRQIVGVTVNQEGNEVLSQGAVWTPGANPPLALLGTPFDVANGINNAGQVAGAHRFAANVNRAVIFSDGRFQDLGTLGGRESTGYAINESGQVAGFSAAASGLQHAFLYSSGTMHDLGTLTGGWSYAYGMNDRGQVVGGATVAPGHEAPTHPVVYSGGTVTDLSRFAAEQGTANSINNLGQVAGVARIGNDDYHGFLYEDGVMTRLGIPGALASAALSINDKGDVVGYSALSFTESHAFLYTDGNTIDLNTLLDTQEDWTVNMASVINEQGDIAGVACRPHPDAAGALDCASVLMTPVPEPAGPALWTCAALFAWAIHGHAAWRRRHRSPGGGP
jgi:probable HAF family extracellular repeat protein